MFGNTANQGLFQKPATTMFGNPPSNPSTNLFGQNTGLGGVGTTGNAPTFGFLGQNQGGQQTAPGGTQGAGLFGAPTNPLGQGATAQPGTTQTPLGQGTGTPNLFAQPQNPLNQPNKNPLGQPQNPLGQPQNPLGQPQNPLGQPQNPPGQAQNPLGQPQNNPLFGNQNLTAGGGGGMFAGAGATIGNQNKPQGTQQPGPPIGDPSRNTQPEQPKSNLTFGADLHKKGSPTKDPSLISQAIPQHMTIEELFRRWKKELEEQVNEFLKLGRELNKDERDLYEMHQMLFNLNSNIKQLETDYSHIQTSLGGLEKQQDDLITKLNDIESELSKALPNDSEESHIKSTTLINKTKELNRETILIEDQIQNLVDEVNQPLKEYNEDVNKILNSYYEALEYIELDTLAIQNKLSSFEMMSGKP